MILGESRIIPGGMIHSCSGVVKYRQSGKSIEICLQLVSGEVDIARIWLRQPKRLSYPSRPTISHSQVLGVFSEIPDGRSLSLASRSDLDQFLQRPVRINCENKTYAWASCGCVTSASWPTDTKAFSQSADSSYTSIPLCPSYPQNQFTRSCFNSPASISLDVLDAEREP
jgi:hypothetical protein